jgi:predicted deacylase
MPNGLQIAAQTVEPGTRRKLALDIGKLYDHTDITIPLKVICGKDDGPTLFVSAAIHGDELNGIAACHRLLDRIHEETLRGTLLVIPIVNVFGFNTLSRYLPDRRDLNRSFPGSETGSLASRLAYTFLHEVVAKATHGIDLHTAAIHRYNLPQIRAETEDPETLRLAQAFGMPVILRTNSPDGSLREAVRERGIPMLLFEGGEALRFNESVIRHAVEGILNVMHAIGMLPEDQRSKPRGRNRHRPFLAKGSYWLRAPQGGIVHLLRGTGVHVRRDEVVARIADPYGSERASIVAPMEGIVIGRNLLPLVHEGDPVFHIATFEESAKVEESLLDMETIMGA